MNFRRLLPIRFQIMILIFFSRCLIKCLHTNLVLCLPYMTYNLLGKREKAWCLMTKAEKKNGTILIASIWHTLPNYGPRYNWTLKQQEYISDAFVWGYMVTVIPAGIITNYFGPFYIIMICLVMAATTNIIRVFLAAMYWKALLILECFSGMCMSLITPGLAYWIARWSPINERGLFACCFLGHEMGFALMKMEARLLVPLMGWRPVFYFTSCMTYLFAICVWFLGANYPEDHKNITEEELGYIKRLQKGQVTKTKAFPPLGKILHSEAFWSVVCLHFASAYGMNFRFQTFRKYMRRLLGFSVTTAWTIDLLPHFGILSFAFLSGAIDKYLRTNDILNGTAIAKLAVILSHIIPGFSLIFIGIVHCNLTIVLTLMIMGITTNGARVISELRTLVDLAPNFAGCIYGIGMVFDFSANIILPRINMLIFKLDKGVIGWTIIYLVTGGCFIGTAVIFLFFGVDNCQWWNNKSQDIRDMVAPLKPPDDSSLVSKNNLKEAGVQVQSESGTKKELGRNIFKNVFKKKKDGD